jgi:hypothetical protein
MSKLSIQITLEASKKEQKRISRSNISIMSIFMHLNSHSLFFFWLHKIVIQRKKNSFFKIYVGILCTSSKESPISINLSKPQLKVGSPKYFRLHVEVSTILLHYKFFSSSKFLTTKKLSFLTLL